MALLFVLKLNLAYESYNIKFVSLFPTISLVYMEAVFNLSWLTLFLFLYYSLHMMYLSAI